VGDFTIKFTRSARKELEAFDINLVERIFTQIERLSLEPRPRGTKKIKGERGLWRIRIGNYRVIYHIDTKANIVDIITIRHRQDAYK
jgi:mRNA interferase RelE/StbE